MWDVTGLFDNLGLFCVLFVCLFVYVFGSGLWQYCKASLGIWGIWLVWKFGVFGEFGNLGYLASLEIWGIWRV